MDAAQIRMELAEIRMKTAEIKDRNFINPVTVAAEALELVDQTLTVLQHMVARLDD